MPSVPLLHPKTSSKMVTSHYRLSPVKDIRLNAPYIAFSSDTKLPHAHSSPTARENQTAGSSRNCYWVSNKGYGSRHTSDLAPFSLWDGDRHDFRLPRQEEFQWIFETFQVNNITFEWPKMVIETDNPPKPVPLTIGCVAAIFVPVGGHAPKSLPMGYSNPRIEDPVPVNLKLAPWHKPSQEQVEAIFAALEQVASIVAINFVPPRIIVELADDGKSYGTRSLPGIVAGRTTLYHHEKSPFWSTSLQSRERLIQPRDTTQDQTDYTAASGTMCPGVRVESGLTASVGGYLNDTTSSSAGVLLHSTRDGQRLTVANHKFKDSEEVFHPTSRGDGTCVGQIIERFEALDISLVKLHPSMSFTNVEYFQAEPPRRLVRSDNPALKYGLWCSVDGMASGLVFLQMYGIRLQAAQRPPGAFIPMTTFKVEHVFEYVGPEGNQIRDGICGAPIVVDGDMEYEGGDVVGLFQLGAQGSPWAIVPCLDDLIDRGWAIV